MKRGVTKWMYYYMLDFKLRNMEEFQSLYWKGAKLSKLTKIQLINYFQHCTGSDIASLKTN